MRRRIKKRRRRKRRWNGKSGEAVGTGGRRGLFGNLRQNVEEK